MEVGHFYCSNNMFNTESPLYQLFQKYRLEFALVSIALLIPVIGLVFINSSIAQDNEEIVFQHTTPIKSTKKIYIDISGAVMNPDVYELEENSRLQDVIKAAGGLSENADTTFFYRNFNQARILNDQDKIYVPTFDEISQGTIKIDKNSINSTQESTDVVLNINTASSEELEALPSIGAVTAKKIIDNRPYNSVDELKNQAILNSSQFDKIKNLIEI